MNQFESKEDYLERILMIQEEKGSCRATDIALALNYTKPSVSIAMKKLKEEKFIKVDPKTGNITLTDSGMFVATEILQRHQVLTKMLLQLGVSPAQAKEDACKIEHDISPETFQAIKNLVSKS